MHLVVNGQPMTFDELLSVAELVVQLGYDRALVAVERNQEVVPRRTWDEAQLQDNDEIEVVTFVGGG